MPGKIKFVCEGCRFRFMRNKGWSERTCPFCGKKGTVHEELSVADLVDLDDN